MKGHMVCARHSTSEHKHLLTSEERQAEMVQQGLWLWVTFHRFLTPGLGLAASDSLFCNLARAGRSWNPQDGWARRLSILLKALPLVCPYISCLPPDALTCI